MSLMIQLFILICPIQPSQPLACSMCAKRHNTQLTTFRMIHAFTEVGRKTMSLNMKTILTALLLMLVMAQWNTASAQVSQMRLWSPPRSDQFGGYGHLREGMFGEVSYNYWLITKGKNQTIGWVEPNGVQNLYFTGTAFMPRTNTMSTGTVGNTFTGGTTLRIGNMIKHHGWEIKSTIMQPQKDSFNGRGGTMDIDEDPWTTQIYVPPMVEAQGWYYNGMLNNPAVKFSQIPLSGNIPSGYIWGWFPVGPSALGLPDDAGDTFYALAPLPIKFDHYKLESKISHWDLEANYIFRAHATKIGFFEFTGGVRYMQLDDNLTFSGWGMPWGGNVRIDADPSYTGDNLPYDNSDSNTGSTTTGTTNNNNNNNTTAAVALDITEYYLQNGSLPGLDRNYSYTGDLRGPGTVLADSRWNFEAQNHLVGPQVGIRYIRKCSGRWSLIADSKFFAGFNTQNIKSDGYLGAPTATIDAGSLGGDLITDTGTLPWVPIGTMQTPGTFHYSQTRTAFSPGIDFGLKANWRLTDAIAFNFGYQGMYLDKTARASLINNYSIDQYGNIFGINSGKVTQSTWMHGFSIEASINRF